MERKHNFHTQIWVTFAPKPVSIIERSQQDCMVDTKDACPVDPHFVCDVLIELVMIDLPKQTTVFHHL